MAKRAPIPLLPSSRRAGSVASIPNGSGESPPTSNSATRQRLATPSHSGLQHTSMERFSSVPTTITTTLPTFRSRGSEPTQPDVAPVRLHRGHIRFRDRAVSHAPHWASDSLTDPIIRSIPPLHHAASAATRRDTDPACPATAAHSSPGRARGATPASGPASRSVGGAPTGRLRLPGDHRPVGSTPPSASPTPRRRPARRSVSASPATPPTHHAPSIARR